MACQPNAKLENRIVALEKASAEKDKQIEGLTVLSYGSLLVASDLDSTETFNLPKSFKKYNFASTATCKAECLRKLRVHLNVCRHVPPQNKTWCIEKALERFDRCEGNCN